MSAARDGRPETADQARFTRLAEAAAVLGISAQAARQRLVRGRRRLRAELDGTAEAGAGDGGPASFTPKDSWPRAAAKR